MTHQYTSTQESTMFFFNIYRNSFKLVASKLQLTKLSYEYTFITVKWSLKHILQKQQKLKDSSTTKKDNYIRNIINHSKIVKQHKISKTNLAESLVMSV